MKQGHKIFVLLSILVVFIGISNFGPLQKSYASLSENVQGFAWTDTIGWINFNCTTVPGGCTKTNHGVNLDLTTGNIVGYAWSDNIGWIKFDPTFQGPYPNLGGNKHGAKFFDSGNGTGKVKGWARACAVYQSPISCSDPVKILSGPNLGGWDGWISFDCSDDPVNGCSGPKYGVTYDSNPTPGEFSGFAWGGGNPAGGMFVGWISFNHKDTPGVSSNYVVTGPTKKINNLTCFNNIAYCFTPNIKLEIKESAPATLPYGSSVTLNQTGGNVDLNWSNDAQGIASSSLRCDLTSTNPWFSKITNDPGSGTKLSNAVPINNTTSSVTTTITISCVDGYHTIAPKSVIVTVPGTVPTGQAIAQVILEARTTSTPPPNPLNVFNLSSINFPSGSGSINLQWSILYTDQNANAPKLDVICDGSQIGSLDWLKTMNGSQPWTQSSVVNGADYDIPSIANPNSLNVSDQDGINPKHFSLLCHDKNTPNVKVQSNTIDVSFGLAPTATLTLNSWTNGDSSVPATSTYVKLGTTGGDVDFQLQGANIDSCVVTSANSQSPTSSEDNDWKNIGGAINSYLVNKYPASVTYITTPKINVTKSTTFGISCTEAPPGIRTTHSPNTWSEVTVQVGTKIAPKIVPPKPKYIFF